MCDLHRELSFAVSMSLSLSLSLCLCMWHAIIYRQGRDSKWKWWMKETRTRRTLFVFYCDTYTYTSLMLDGGCAKSEQSQFKCIAQRFHKRNDNHMVGDERHEWRRRNDAFVIILVKCGRCVCGRHTPYHSINSHLPIKSSWYRQV